MKNIVFVVLMAFGVSAHAQIYECNGKFTDKPCSATRTAADLVKDNQAKEQKKQQILAEQKASRPEPYIGMSSSVQTIWGEPSKVNTTKTIFGVTEQWVYRGAFKTKYLYFTNGKLTSMSE